MARERRQRADQRAAGRLDDHLRCGGAGELALGGVLQAGLAHLARGVIGRPERRELVRGDGPDRPDEVGGELRRDRAAGTDLLELSPGHRVDVARTGLGLELLEARLRDLEDRLEERRVCLGLRQRRLDRGWGGAGADQVGTHLLGVLDAAADEADVDHVLSGDERGTAGAGDARARWPVLDGGKPVGAVKRRVDGGWGPGHLPDAVALHEVDGGGGSPSADTGQGVALRNARLGAGSLLGDAPGAEARRPDPERAERGGVDGGERRGRGGHELAHGGPVTAAPRRQVAVQRGLRRRGGAAAGSQAGGKEQRGHACRDAPACPSRRQAITGRRRTTDRA